MLGIQEAFCIWGVITWSNGKVSEKCHIPILVNSYMSHLHTNSYMSCLHTNSYMSHLHTNCSMSRLHTNSYKSRVHTSVLARPKRQGAAPCCFFLRPVVFQALFSVISGLNLPKSIEIKAVRRAEAHNVSGFMYCVVMDTRFMSQSNRLFLTHMCCLRFASHISLVHHVFETKVINA